MGVAQHSWALGRVERAGDPAVLRNGWGPGRANGLAGSAQGGQWWPGGPGGHGLRTRASPAPSPSGAGRASPAPWGPGSASDPQTLHLSFPGLWAQQGEPPAWAPGRHRPPSRARGSAPAPCRGRGHVVHLRLCPEPASTAPSSAVPGDSRPPGAPAWLGRQATGRGRKNNNRDSAGRSLWRGRRAVRGPTAGGLWSAAGPRGGRSCEGPRGGRVAPRGSAVSHVGAVSGRRGDRRRGREGVRGAPCAALGGLCGIRLSAGEARARACAGSWEGSREDLCERGGDSVGLRSYVGSSVGTVWGQSRAAA